MGPWPGSCPTVVCAPDETRTTSSTSTPSSLKTRMASVWRSSQVTGPPAPQALADGAHRALGGALAAPDPVELGRRLHPAALVEELAAGLDLDLVRAQEVGDAERKVPRRHGRLDPGSAARAEHELRHHVVPGIALLDELVEPQLLERDDLEARPGPAGAKSRASRRTPSACRSAPRRRRGPRW